MRIRRARAEDAGAVGALLAVYVEQGLLLPRTPEAIRGAIGDFLVAVDGGAVVGCVALELYGARRNGLAEIRSLAVDPSLKTHGVGRRLVEALEQEARDAGLHAIFAFTYVPDFFRKVGFHEVERGELPLKVWKDCLRCPKFQCCDEIAVLKALRPDAVISAGPEPEAALIQLPHVKQNGARTSPGLR